VAQPKTVLLSFRIRTGEYDALCERASQQRDSLSEVTRKAIRLFLNE
jgi:hypothetical protein